GFSSPDGFVNTGMLRANGGILQLGGGTFANSAGQIEIAPSGSLTLESSTIVGGTLTAQSNNQINAMGATLKDLDIIGNPTINVATLALAGTVNFHDSITFLTG